MLSGEKVNRDKAGEQIRGSRYKEYVNVKAEFSADGALKPLSLMWKNGREYKIDRVRDCRRAASFKAGGIGIRYICEVKGQMVNLFYEENYRWFVVPK